HDLARAVDAYVANAGPVAVTGELIGLISPHAGLMYSGPIAAYGYGLLRGRGELTAVLVGPSHRAAFRGVAAVSRGSFETPFGRVPIDEDVVQAILDAG